MIKFANAPLAAGKTYQMAAKSIEKLNEGRSVLNVVPTHAAGTEAITMARKNPFEEGYIVQLTGKRKETCIKEANRAQCSRCAYQKKALALLSSEGEGKPRKLGEELYDLVNGKIVDLALLQELSSQFEICPTMLSRILAFAEHPRVVVACHAYFSSYPALDILEQIKVDHVYIDEMDALIDGISNNSNRALVLMEPRKCKTSTIRDECGGACKDCHPHLSDSCSHKFHPYSGRIEDFGGISNKKNLFELLSVAITNVETAVRRGYICDLFHFDNIRQVLNRVISILPEYIEGQTTLDYLRSLENANEATAIEIMEPHHDEGAQFAYPIKTEPVTKQGYTSLGDMSEFNDDKMRMRSLKQGLWSDPDKPADISGLNAFLAFVDFVQNAPGEMNLVPQKYPLQNGRGGYDRCGLKLRYLNTHHYDRVKAYLHERNCKAFSGTLLSARMIGASLLADESEFTLTNIQVPFHRSGMIVVHNHWSPEEPEPKELPPWAAAKLYGLIQAKIPDITLLHFATNTKQANAFFGLVCGDSKMRSTFRIENRKKDYVELDLDSAREADSGCRSALLSIDKVRSAWSRGLNRRHFNVCTVIGNGIANWDNQITLFLEARKKYPNLTIWDLISYEQTRALVQALMRAPRDAELTVCLYAGNLHPLAFPSFLQNQIVTTQELIRAFEKDVPNAVNRANSLEYQLAALSHGITTFLRGDQIEIPPPPQPDSLNPLLVGWHGRSDAAESRLSHVDSCIGERGYIDRTEDRRGERPSWNSFLNWLVSKKYLRPERRGRKIVYVRMES